MVRAYNSKFPDNFPFKAKIYDSPVEIFREAQPPANVVLNTFMTRIRRLIDAGSLNEFYMEEALYLDAGEYRKKYATRKTWVTLSDQKISLEDFYKENSTAKEITYRTFWQRVKSLKSRKLLDNVSLDKAINLPEKEWVSFFGGGRSNSFVYEGDCYSEHSGKNFRSVTSFLRTVDRYNDRQIIWSRMKNGWSLETALSIPVSHDSLRQGSIYQITRCSTQEIYVGLTLGSIEQRWAFHVRNARSGATSRLAQAIRSDGPEGFSLKILETDIPNTKALKEREIFWVTQLNSLAPNGLNTAPPGGLGAPKGLSVTVNGEAFRSMEEAAQILSERSGLARHVILKRLRNGRPLLEKARRHSKHPEAGSNLFRRWLALLRRHPEAVCERWKNNYDHFKADVSPFSPSQELIRKNNFDIWGPNNFLWVDAKTKIESILGKKLIVHGIEFPSIKAVAQYYGIGTSTLKDRIGRQSLSIEEAVALQLSATSYKRTPEGISINGKIFRSKRQAILYISEALGITEGQAKYRFSIGEYDSAFLKNK